MKVHDQVKGGITIVKATERTKPMNAAKKSTTQVMGIIDLQEWNLVVRKAANIANALKEITTP